MCVRIDSYIKPDSTTFFSNDIFGADEYFRVICKKNYVIATKNLNIYILLPA